LSPSLAVQLLGPVLTATGLVDENSPFSTPQRIHVTEPIARKFVSGDPVHDFYCSANFGGNQSTGGGASWWQNDVCEHRA